VVILRGGLVQMRVDVGLLMFDAQLGSPSRYDVEGLEHLVVQSLPPWRKHFLHRERNPYVWRLTHACAEEFLRSDADDGVDRRANAHFLADDRGSAPETPLPPSVACHRYRAAPGKDRKSVV